MKRFPTQTNKQTKAKCTSNSFHTIVSVLCERARVPFYPVYLSIFTSFPPNPPLFPIPSRGLSNLINMHLKNSFPSFDLIKQKTLQTLSIQTNKNMVSETKEEKNNRIAIQNNRMKI